MSELFDTPTPIMQPNKVSGVVAKSDAHVDRFFYILDPSDDRVWEVDGYRVVEGQKEHWCLHLICPRCMNNLRLESQKKELEVSERGVRTEPVTCTWFHHGSPCGWKAWLEYPSRGLSKVRLQDGREQHIDAVVRR